MRNVSRVEELFDEVFQWVGGGPLGPLGFKCSQHSPTTRPSVERTAEKAFLLSDRVQFP